MFKKATKEDAYLRLAIFGAPGNGKTKFALALGKLLGRCALIDTEHGSASKYSDAFDFDSCNLDTFSPDSYVTAITAAGKAGYEVLIIDSLSHAWSGKGGCLEIVDRASQGANKFAGWRDVTPMHNRLIEAILAYPGHVICTMRSKTEYVLNQNDRGKMVPSKVGLAPIQRDNTEYEFDVVGRLEDSHDLTILKSRCETLDNKVLPAADAYEICYVELKLWLGNKPKHVEEVVSVTPQQFLHSDKEPVLIAPSVEDWANLKMMGFSNNWPESYMKLWIDREKKKGKTNIDVFQAATAKFSTLNENAIEEEVPAV